MIHNMNGRDCDLINRIKTIGTNELKKKEHMQNLKKTAKDCFVGVISSHGEEGVVFGADGRAVKLAEIYSYFGGPSMADKSKLFLIQACRGHELDGGAKVEADSSFSEEEDGYAAFMHPLGSVLIQTLCDLLEKEGGPELEIQRLLTRLNYQVAYNFESRGKVLGGKKQMPCFVTRFTREVFPFMDSQTAAAADLSLTFAATQLIDEPRRSRKNSIS
uniref:Caspase family p20 domain-containing protein n=1 Tax=Sinocyclocheilus rhinocerous TaxID=307959 RepID=A0A673KZ66_9TELE